MRARFDPRRPTGHAALRGGVALALAGLLALALAVGGAALAAGRGEERSSAGPRAREAAPRRSPADAEAADVGPAFGPPPPWARYGAFRGPPDAVLALHAPQVRERVEVRPFRADGSPDPDAFAAIARAMRCKRTGRERAIDPRLVVLLADLQAKLRVRALHVVSGFRAADAHTKATSQHVQGMAADVRVPGVGPGRLYRVAEALGAGGVGLYPRRTDRFVHVDVRDQPARWRERWNRSTAKRPVRDARAHSARRAAWPLP